MKSTIKFAGLFFLFICSFLVVLDIQQVSARNDGMEEALSSSMRNTLKSSNVDSMYEVNERDMQVEFLRNFANSYNNDGTIQVSFITASKEGLLDVEIENEFVHNNGAIGKRSIRKTLIVEQAAQ